MGRCNVHVKVGDKNVRILSNCITRLSLHEPLLSAFTRLRLSHWNSTDCLAGCGPHTVQLHIMGTSSLAIMPSGCHSGTISIEATGFQKQPHTPVLHMRQSGLQWLWGVEGYAIWVNYDHSLW